MKIESPESLADVIKDPELGKGSRLLFTEREGASLEAEWDELIESPASVTALIGPEGGYADDEIAQARESGWKIVTLGGRIMRAETAAIAVAALLQHRLGDLN